MNPNGSIEIPDLRALLNAHRDELFAAFNAVQLGTVVSFDPSTQTITATINAQRVVYDQSQTSNEGLPQVPRLVDYPPLTDVPVVVLSGGAARLTLPITKGDTCVLFFNDRDMDAWWASGQIVAPNSPRMHSLSDAVALVGVRSKANAIEEYEAENAVLRLGSTLLRIKPDGAFEVEQDAGGDAPAARIKVGPDGSVTALASGDKEATVVLAADGSVTAQNTGGSISIDPSGAITLNSGLGGSVQVAEKLRLNAAAESLKNAMDAVVTALTALNAKTGPSAAAQIAAASTALNNVLE